MAPDIRSEVEGLMMQTDQLRQSAMAMKLMGWSVIIGLPISLGFYPPGFFWGSLPQVLRMLVRRIPSRRMMGFIPACS